MSTVCHCGRPVKIHYDLNDDGSPFTRNLCEDCDTVRCDAFPTDCQYRNDSNYEEHTNA